MPRRAARLAVAVGATVVVMACGGGRTPIASLVRDRCAPQECSGGSVYSCCGSKLWKWNGLACVDVSHTATCTCDRSGPDCGRLFYDEAACREAYASCAR
jgi:hypothetical protein